jgi:multidrug resistance efflux pump
MREDLVKTGHVAKTGVIESRLALMNATKKRDAAKQEFLEATQRRELQTLRAPIDGVVQQLAVTTVGGVVTAAQALLTIVPEHTPLEIEAQVANRDIEHIKVGQRVINKVGAVQDQDLQALEALLSPTP